MRLPGWTRQTRLPTGPGFAWTFGLLNFFKARIVIALPASGRQCITHASQSFRRHGAMGCRSEQTYLDILERCGTEGEKAPTHDENCNRCHARLSQIATHRATLTIKRLGEACWCRLRNSRNMSDVKGKPNPKRRALVDDTLHCDRPAMFLNDAFHDREA